MEAPASEWPVFNGKVMATAGFVVASEVHQADWGTDAGDLKRQRAHRGALAGKRAHAYGWGAFGAGRR